MPRWQRLLASFEFLGGVCCMAGAVLPKDPLPDMIGVTIPIFPFLAGAVAILAGFLLVIQAPSGLWLSFLVQAAQILSFTASWRYLFLAGPRLTWLIGTSGSQLVLGGGGLGIATTQPADGVLAGIGLSSEVMIGIAHNTQMNLSWTVGINFVAIYFAVRIWSCLHPSEDHATAEAPPAAA